MAQRRADWRDSPERGTLISGSVPSGGRSPARPLEPVLGRHLGRPRNAEKFGDGLTIDRPEVVFVWNVLPNAINRKIKWEGCPWVVEKSEFSLSETPRPQARCNQNTANSLP
jgi:hypothetical protein